MPVKFYEKNGAYVLELKGNATTSSDIAKIREHTNNLKELNYPKLVIGTKDLFPINNILMGNIVGILRNYIDTYSKQTSRHLGITGVEGKLEDKLLHLKLTEMFDKFKHPSPDAAIKYLN